jgi:Skp family chaperone for outer membrane proteins
MKKTLAVFSAMALACAISLPAAAQQHETTTKLKRVQMGKEKEQHPEIAAAMHHLKEAKESLEHANHDFGGHRVAALKHINEAIEECRQALEFDKK